MPTLRGALASLVLGAAVALVLVAVAILPFLNPVWVGWEQGRAQATAWTGFSADDLGHATDAILADLVLGPPAFDVTVGAAPVLEERERQHMRDVRAVFAAFFVAAALGAAVLAAAFAATRGDARVRLWRRLRRAGIAIAAIAVIGGLLGVVFFDAAFELFHELFFPPGSYLFDPRTDRLVQLFPEQFWVETTIGVGLVLVALALGMAWVAGRRAGALEHDAGWAPRAPFRVSVR